MFGQPLNFSRSKHPKKKKKNCVYIYREISDDVPLNFEASSGLLLPIFKTFSSLSHLYVRHNFFFCVTEKLN